MEEGKNSNTNHTRPSQRGRRRVPRRGGFHANHRSFRNRNGNAPGRSEGGSTSANFRESRPIQPKSNEIKPQGERESLESKGIKRGNRSSETENPEVNNLISFHLAPRTTRQGMHSWGRRHTFPNRTRRRYNSFKGAFIQANCQFVVKVEDAGFILRDDANAPIDWDIILLLIIESSGETPICPICLYPPVVPKMTMCGHFYCWPCILHYLAVAEKKPAECPICFEAINRYELKSVEFKPAYETSPGKEISLRLMCCRKDTILIRPVVIDENDDAEWQRKFCRVILTSASEDIADREHTQLTELLEQDVESENACFIQQALMEIERHRQSKQTEGHVDKIPAQRRKSWLESTTWEGESKTPATEKSNWNNGEDIYFFYQASNGQRTYLHPVNMAMMLKMFGKEANDWPATLTLKVLDKEDFSVEDDNKKRVKYLRHLPNGATFELVEVELKPPLISMQVCADFEAKIASRAVRRLKKQAEQESAACSIRDSIHVSTGFASNEVCSPKIGSMDDFPEWDYPPTQSARNSSNDPDTATLGPTNEEDKIHAHPSFAKIVSSKHGSDARNVNSNCRPAQSSQVSRDLVSSAIVDEEAAPAFKSSLSDAIAAAMDKVDLSGQGNAKPEGGSKKKKKKGKVLFSTGFKLGSML